jgi:hypothetical protein
MKRLSSPYVAAFLALPCLVGCMSARSPAASQIREADVNMVSGCTYVGEVFGSSGAEDPDVGIENAKTRALEQAASKQATHVVWNALVAGKQPNVSGKAYRCPPAAPAPRIP